MVKIVKYADGTVEGSEKPMGVKPVSEEPIVDINDSRLKQYLEVCYETGKELIVTDVFRFTCPKCGKESVITGLLPTEKLIDSEEGNE